MQRWRSGRTRTIRNREYLHFCSINTIYSRFKSNASQDIEDKSAFIVPFFGKFLVN